MSCVLLSPPSRYFLVFDRLFNDVVQVRHWWFGRGGTFIRTLPAFTVELIVWFGGGTFIRTLPAFTVELIVGSDEVGPL